MKTTILEVPTQEELDVLPSHGDVVGAIVLYYFREVLQNAIDEVEQGSLTLKGALGGRSATEGAQFMDNDALQLILSLTEDRLGEFRDTSQRTGSLESTINTVLAESGPLRGLLDRHGLRVRVTCNGAGRLRARIVAVRH